jgi:hypothetical protein
MPDDANAGAEDQGETDRAAQVARAKRLREQIAQLKGKAGGSVPTKPPATPKKPESPRDFIDRKMRETDEDPER